MKEPKKQSNGLFWNVPDREWLEQEYATLGKTMTQIAREVGTTEVTVLRWLEKAQIETRPRGNVPIVPPSRAWLERQYVELDKTAQRIADELGVSQPTVTKWLEQLGIPSLWGSRGTSRGCYNRRAHEILGRAGVPYKCAKCDRGPKETWIDLHHVDGDWTNNNLTNLQYLCASCHAIAHDRGRNFR